MSDNLKEISRDDFLRTLPIGSVGSAISNHLYGFNHQQIAGLVPNSTDQNGLVFFTRPQLNLSSNNIRNIRKFYSLLTDTPDSIQRYVRCMLDPRLMTNAYGEEPMVCPLVDNEQAFIPVLTNSLKTLSGWSDIAVHDYTTKPGRLKEVYAQVDGTAEQYGDSTLDANFNNSKTDPIILMFYVWVLYQSFVFENKMVPYPDFWAYNRIDYNTRIYRLVLNEQKTTVTKITANGAGFPLNVPLGQFFDYNIEEPLSRRSKNITVRFKSLGTCHLDDILVKEFNTIVGIFNPSMRDDFRDISMVKIPMRWLGNFNHRGYPRIEPDTYKLDWYVKKEVFTGSVSNFEQNPLTKNTNLL